MRYGFRETGNITLNIEEGIILLQQYIDLYTSTFGCVGKAEKYNTDYRREVLDKFYNLQTQIIK